ncbi:MAG TPA: hypothetical protein PLJ19_10235 [Dysgonamonadaceae bacterium]|nr:hypothetical protein [Dysgonamonadaceae bacterium]
MSTKRSEAKWAGAQWASVHALAGKGSEKNFHSVDYRLRSA